MDILIDTNIILHFRRLDELDWCDLAGVTSCSLIVTPVLMRELERNKVSNPNTKLRQRAREAILWLAKKLGEKSPTRLRKGVTLIFDDQEPLLDFAEHRLSRDIADDHFIASAIDWSKRSGKNVAIATADSGFALKLRSRPVGYLQPGDEWRLPDAIDAERDELKEIKRQLDRERNRRPNLSVQFEGEGKVVSVKSEAVEPPKSLDDVRALYSRMSLGEYAAADNRRESEVGIYSSEPVHEYNRALGAFFDEYEIYLSKHRIWAEQEERTIELVFSLANLGSAPASNIDVTLNFPSHVEVIAVEDAPEEPEEPEPPLKPRPNQRIVMINRAISIPTAFESPSLRNEGEPNISRDKRSADYYFQMLKHQCAYDSEPVLVRFATREQMKPFDIEVSITCNEADKVVDRLVVHPTQEA